MVVELRGSLNLLTAERLRTAMADAVCPDLRLLVLYVSGVRFCDAIGVQALSEIAEGAKERHIEVRLVEPPGGALHRLLVTVGLTQPRFDESRDGRIASPRPSGSSRAEVVSDGAGVTSAACVDSDDMVSTTIPASPLHRSPFIWDRTRDEKTDRTTNSTRWCTRAPSVRNAKALAKARRLRCGKHRSTKEEQCVRVAGTGALAHPGWHGT